MLCPHCHQEVRLKGPNCPRCHQPILGREAPGGEDQPQAPPESRPPGGKARRRPSPAAPAAGPSEAAPPGEEGSEVEAYVSLDLDTLEAETRAAEERAAILSEVAVPAGAAEERYDALKAEEAAESAYDETVMGGVYVAAVLGAIAGLRLGGWPDTTAWLYGAVAALIGAGVGYLAGVVVGSGAQAGVRTLSGQRMLLTGGVLLATAPAAVMVVWLAQWGVAKHLIWTVATYGVIAFAFFGLTYQDARYRQRKNPLLWGLISGLLPPLYPLYMARRPHGELVECANPECSERHLAILDRCPRCGYRRRAGRPLAEEVEL